MASQDDRELSRSEDMPAEDVSVEGAVFWYLLLIVVAVSLFWRVTVLEPNPSTYHLPRYYAGMVHARMVWLHLHADERTESETEWLNANLRPFGEPPLLETLTSFVCMPLGSIQPRVACVITCLAWLAGGWFVFRTAELITKHRFAALAALAFYLLCPLAIVMSQMFQPEGLMTLALVVAIWMLVRFPPDQRWRRTLFLAVVCAVAGFVKPGILFLPIMGAYLGMRLGKDSLLKILFDGRSLLFAVVTLIPSVVWVLVFLQDRVGGKLMPAMLLDPMFYVHWFQKIDETLGWWVLVVLVVALSLGPRLGATGWVSDLRRGVPVAHRDPQLLPSTAHPRRRTLPCHDRSLCVGANPFPAAWETRRGRGFSPLAGSHLLVSDTEQADRRSRPACGHRRTSRTRSDSATRCP